MGFFNNVTRGGQLNLHQLRMFHQIFNSAFVISLFVSVLYFAYQVKQDLPEERFRSTLEYVQAKYLVSISHIFNNKDIKQNIIIQGKPVEIKSSEILTSTYYIKSLNLTKKYLVKIFIKSGICWFLSFISILGIWFYYGRNHKKTDITKGKNIVTPEILAHELKKAKLISDLKIENLPLVKDYEKQHIFACGTTGSGKTNFFNIIIPQIRKRPNKAVIIDVTGEYIAKYYNPATDFIFNPLDARSVNWNIWADCYYDSHYETFAESIIPDKKGQYDDVWDQSGRLVLVEILKKLAKQNKCEIKEINKLINKGDFNEIEDFLKGTIAGNIINKKADKTAFSVLMNLLSKISFLKYLKDTENKFSIRKWVENESNQNSWLFISAMSDQIASLRPLISAVSDVALNSILSLSRNTDRRIWFIIDELPKLNKLPSLITGLAESRKYGGCIMIGIQSISQLTDIYGYDTSKAIVDMFSTFVYFRTNDPQTTEWVSKALGVVEQEELNEHLSYGANSFKDGISFSKQMRIKHLVLPIEIEIANLKALEAYIKYAGFDITKVKMDYKKQQDINPGFVLKEYNLMEK